jgi:hypothetical protein
MGDRRAISGAKRMNHDRTLRNALIRPFRNMHWAVCSVLVGHILLEIIIFILTYYTIRSTDVTLNT